MRSSKGCGGDGGQEGHWGETADGGETLPCHGQLTPPVMAGLDPAIHLSSGTMDGRLKGGHDKRSG